MIMNNKFLHLTTCLLILGMFSANAQLKIKGVIKDAAEGYNLYGATVTLSSELDGYKEEAQTSFDGVFEINSKINAGVAEISFIGYETQTIPYFKNSNSITVDLGTIELKPYLIFKKDIVVTTSSIDVVKDRETPISSSTYRNFEMREKVSNKDFIELTNSMPGVYTSRVGGGYGDTRMNVRGFEQNNISPMIDGIPVYDLEAGLVDWANIASISDMASSIQLQRGLGASKLVNSSVAGTMNIILRNADHQEGGFLSNSTGNDGYKKFVGSYGTGLLPSGFSTNILLSSTSGDGYVNATSFEAYSYYIALGLKKKKHDFQFKVFGSPQVHNQRVSDISLSNYIANGNGVDQPNYKYNSDWGYLNNKQYGTKVDYGHKPFGIFQWDINFTDKTQLSTKLYGSTGTSGKTNFAGGILGRTANNFRDANGNIDLNFIQQYNSDGFAAQFPGSNLDRDPNSGSQFVNSSFVGSFTNSGGNTVLTYDSGISLLSEITNQTFYGGIVNLSTQLADNLKLSYGLDARKTLYNKTRIVNNLFGASAYSIDFEEGLNIGTPNGIWYSVNTNNTALPEPILNFGKKNLGATPVDYKYDAKIAYAGSYAQIDYSIWNLNFLLQGGFNRQFIQRVDYSLLTDTKKETSELAIDGYNSKLGINYNITSKHNIWGNAGYVSRPPVFVTVYSGLNNDINPNYKNEKFKSVEFGYGFRSRSASINLSGYYADHKDAENPYYTPELGNFGTTSGIDRKNRGVELDIVASPMKKLIVNGTVSVGDWKYTSNAIFQDLRPDTNGDLSNPSTLLIYDQKIGGAPQVMASIGGTYEIFKDFKLGSNVKYNDKMYSSPALERYDPVFYGNVFAFKSPVELPSFTVVDAFASYKFRINVTNFIDLRFNMDNVLNKKYISESNTSYQLDSVDPTDVNGATFKDNGNSYNGVANGNNAFFGLGRTWNFTVRYEF